MYRRALTLIVLCITLFSLNAEGAPTTKRPSWLITEIGIIGAASTDILDQALTKAEDGEFDGLVIQLDTPGGALNATREMIKRLMAATIPVVVWIGPSGSHAGSAGAFLTLAAHVAAMAPSTNIGAAHPVQATGQNVEGDARDKVMNDTLAFIESIARTRGRNVEMARSFVSGSVSITNEEALEHDVIDLIAASHDELFQKIDGMKVTLAGDNTVTIQAHDPAIVVFEKGLKHKILEILSDPNVFYLLFMAGLIGLGFELTHPGTIFPGVAGGICLILALISASVLPISFGAAALILVGIALLVAEAFVPSFGILGIGGFVAFVLGSIFLVDPGNEEGLRISLMTIGPVAVVVALASLGIGYLILKAMRRKAGDSSLGYLETEKATAIENFHAGTGKIRVQGEIWNAKLTRGETVSAGSPLRIVRIDGMTAIVEPIILSPQPSVIEPTSEHQTHGPTT